MRPYIPLSQREEGAQPNALEGLLKKEMQASSQKLTAVAASEQKRRRVLSGTKNKGRRKKKSQGQGGKWKGSMWSLLPKLPVRNKYKEDAANEKDTYALRQKRLEELGFANYSVYLRSELWTSIHSRAFEQYGLSCRLCGNEAKVIHHREYSKETLLGTSLLYLTPLCHKCHRRIEFDAKGNKRSLSGTQTAYDRLLGKTRKKTESSKYCVVCGKKAKKKSLYCRPCAKGLGIRQR